MHKPDPYPMMRQFMAPAWASPAIWRIAVVFCVFEFAFQATPYLYAAPGNGGSDDGPPFGPFDTLLEFSGFIVPCLAMLLAIKLLHRRGLGSLIGPKQQAWRDLIRVTLAVGLVLLLQEPLRLSTEWNYFAATRDVGAWALMLPLALLVLLIQVGTEELYFRGYLQQQLAVVNASRWVWMIFPSVYFGLAHYVNGSAPLEGISWSIWAGCLGLACADLTARTGNLGAAVGLHLANNIFAIVIVGVQDMSSSGLALFLYPAVARDAVTPPISLAATLLDLALSLCLIAVMWLAARLAVRR